MRQQQMVKEGDRIVLGVSGGADSVCLFYVLKNLGYSLEVVHVNHSIREEEAMRDQRFVEELCEKEGVSCHTYVLDVPAIAKAGSMSVEEAGRAVRRKAFLEVLEKTGAEHVALAHHGNDRAETFLFNLSRGTGIRGLSSMRPVEGVFIRPLLWAERADILKFLAEENAAYVEDTTNASEEYTRNRIRHQVIPALEDINFQIYCSFQGRICRFQTAVSARILLLPAATSQVCRCC